MIRRLVFVGLVLALLLAACQVPEALVPTATSVPQSPTLPPPTITPPPPTATSAPSPIPFPESVARSEMVNGNKLIINCKGTGNATVILDNGYASYSWTDPGNYPKITRTCSYTRAGMMETIKGPRTTADVVKDLHDLLTQVGVPGPYILVGHSQAGFNLMLYTGTYPDEVVGLVCVDCLLPIFYDIYIEFLRPKLANDPVRLQTEIENRYPGYAEDSGEKLDFKASIQQALKVTSLGNRPVVMLLAKIDKVDELGILWPSWLEAATRFSKMTTQGRVEIVEDYRHGELPTSLAVYKAIQEVYDKVKIP